MKKFIVATIIAVMASMILSGCSDSERYPYLQYQNSVRNYDSYNKTIELNDIFGGEYVLDSGHSFDIVETENGYDIILHFVENENVNVENESDVSEE